MFSEGIEREWSHEMGQIFCENISLQTKKILTDHLFSAHAKLFKKLTFLTSYANVRVRISE